MGMSSLRRRHRFGFKELAARQVELCCSGRFAGVDFVYQSQRLENPWWNLCWPISSDLDSCRLHSSFAESDRLGVKCTDGLWLKHCCYRYTRGREFRFRNVAAFGKVEAGQNAKSRASRLRQQEVRTLFRSVSARGTHYCGLQDGRR